MEKTNGWCETDFIIASSYTTDIRLLISDVPYQLIHILRLRLVSSDWHLAIAIIHRQSMNIPPSCDLSCFAQLKMGGEGEVAREYLQIEWYLWMLQSSFFQVAALGLFICSFGRRESLFYWLIQLWLVQTILRRELWEAMTFAIRQMLSATLALAYDYILSQSLSGRPIQSMNR